MEIYEGNMCINIYIYTDIFTCACIHIYRYIYMCMYKYIYIYTHYIWIYLNKKENKIYSIYNLYWKTCCLLDFFRFPPLESNPMKNMICRLNPVYSWQVTNFHIWFRNSFRDKSPIMWLLSPAILKAESATVVASFSFRVFKASKPTFTVETQLVAQSANPPQIGKLIDNMRI